LKTAEMCLAAALGGV